MSDLIERYLHQVGRFLPQKERADIEAELRSQIADQIDDRFPGEPTQADVVAVLQEMGDPRRIATSYLEGQYLVGPELYPYLLMVLRNGLLLVPSIIIFLNIFAELINSQPQAFPAFLVGLLLSTLNAVFVFSGAVVLFFAILQHAGPLMKEKVQAFNPLELPEVDDPRAVDRVEAVSGSILGSLLLLPLLYFLRVGGLTAQFNLSNPGEVVPVPGTWLAGLILVVLGQVVLQLLVLRRNRWTTSTWFSQTLLEVAGIICLYFVLFQPIYDRLVLANPALAEMPLLAGIPQGLTILMGLLTLAGKVNRMLQLRRHHSRDVSSQTIIADAG